MKRFNYFGPHLAIFAILMFAFISCNKDDIMEDSLGIDISTIQAGTDINSIDYDPCLMEPVILELLTEKKGDVGYVSITNDEENVYVNYVAEDGWLIAETSLFIGAKDGIPLKKGGEPDQGKFPYKDKFDPPVTSHEYVIPLEEVGECFVILAYAKVNNCEESCECDGKATELTLRYNGAEAAKIIVTQKKDNVVVFDRLVDPNGEFTVVGTDKGTLGTEITIKVDGIENTKIHTSCSKPLYIGMVSGDFTVVDGWSKNGGQLCEQDPDTPTEPDSGCCDGKVTNLTMRYDGTSGANITVNQKKDDVQVFTGFVNPGEEFSFVGTDKGTLGTEIYLYVGDELNTAIHTSCSKPIYIGMTSGDFTIVDGSSKNGGKLGEAPCEDEKKEDDKNEKEPECKNESAWAGDITFEEYFDTDKWGYLGKYCVEECEQRIDFTYAWEDINEDIVTTLRNDADYNDLVIQSDVLKTSGELKINVFASARGAAFDHAFKIRIPALGVISISGVEGWEIDGSDVILTVFSSTKAELPQENIAPHKFAANTAPDDITCTPNSTREIIIIVDDDEFKFVPEAPYEPFITVNPAGWSTTKYDLTIWEISGTDSWTATNGKKYPNGIIISDNWKWPLEKQIITGPYPNFMDIDSWNPAWADTPPEPDENLVWSCD